MQLDDINQESLGNIVGGNPEALDYNLREAHERGYLEGAVTVGDVTGGYVAYLVDMVTGLGVALQLKGPILPASVPEEAAPGEVRSDTDHIACAKEIATRLSDPERHVVVTHGIVPQRELDPARAVGFNDFRLTAHVRQYLTEGAQA
jgi:hypothetical protein